jgi:tetratricopeptide (TPR) repeat protein
MRAPPLAKFIPWVGRASLCLLLLVGAYFAGRQFVATVERVGAPPALELVGSARALAPQAMRRADSVCTRSLELVPSAEALRYCGMIQFAAFSSPAPADRQERRQHAVQYFNKSLNRAPLHGATWLYLASAYLAEGDHAAAAEAFDTSYEVDAIAAGMAGMRVAVGLGMLHALKPITRWSLDAEIQSLGNRNPAYLKELARTPEQLHYVASTLMVNPPAFARFMRAVNAPPPGVRR